MVSCGARVEGFILMTGPSKLAKKAIGKLNATWNSVKETASTAPRASSRMGLLRVFFARDKNSSLQDTYSARRSSLYRQDLEHVLRDCTYGVVVKSQPFRAESPGSIPVGAFYFFSFF